MNTNRKPKTMSPFSPLPLSLQWQEPIAVLGYGAEGKSTLEHLQRWGYKHLVVLDKNTPSEALPDGVKGVFGPAYLEALNTDPANEPAIQTIFRSPGIRPFVTETTTFLPEIEAFIQRGGTLTSQVEAAFELAGKHRIIGVTGTVGKGTCCSLLSAMLTEANITHRLAGNIGVPPLDALYGNALDGNSPLESDAFLLLELSSFQLSTLSESPSLAVVLRTTSEHLDWHATQEEYWDHKANLTRYQNADDVCIYFADSPGSQWIGAAGAGRKLAVGTGPTTDVHLSELGIEWAAGEVSLTLAETQMTGAFNLENVGAAAAAAISLGASPAAVRAGARAFSPLEHRIEFVREISGTKAGAGRVRYYNDSYATRPEAALAAVSALRAYDLGLILGGSEKHADFAPMAAAFAKESHLRAIALIGHTAARLEDELRRAGTLEGRAWKRCETLEDALEFLRGEISSHGAGGAILLSPACASFGLFANYKERGYAFKRLVKALPE